MRTEGGQRGSGEAFTYWEVWPGFKRGGCWQRGQIPNVGLQPGLKEKGPLRWSKWFPVGSDPSVLSPTCKSFFWVLKGQSGQAISLWTSLNHIYVLSFPATPTVRALATARIQRPAKASSAGEVGGVSEKVLKLCVCLRERKPDPRHALQASVAGGGGGKSGLWSVSSRSAGLYVRDNSWKKYVVGSW